MTLPFPWTLRPELGQERLQTVANWLLEEYYSVLDDLHRPTDSGYGRGCTAFDREKNRIWLEHLSEKWPWLGVLNPNNDMVFTIGGVPCRFSNDDPRNPSKQAVTSTNQYQLGFQEFSSPEEASRFCFVVDRGLSGADEPRVEFLGFDVADNLVCHWVSDTPRVLYAESVQEAPEVKIEKATVRPKLPEIDTERSEAANDADNTSSDTEPS
jgi:hypothetical protein